MMNRNEATAGTSILFLLTEHLKIADDIIKQLKRKI